MTLIPHLRKEQGTNRRLTQLDCGFCGRLGHFPIVLVLHKDGRRFACPECAATSVAA